MAPEPAQSGMTWLVFALMTVATWGVYGIFLHTGQVAMGDPMNGRYKAFLFVGIAYVLTAVVAPLIVMVINGASWNFPAKGITWSLLAGVVGAVGAFFCFAGFWGKRATQCRDGHCFCRCAHYQCRGCPVSSSPGGRLWQFALAVCCRYSAGGSWWMSGHAVQTQSRAGRKSFC